jgi:hypothetical protein
LTAYHLVLPNPSMDAIHSHMLTVTILSLGSVQGIKCSARATNRE